MLVRGSPSITCLYTLHSPLEKSRKNAIPLHTSKKSCNFAAESPAPGFRGREVSPLGKPNYLTKHPSRGFQDIFKRRLLTLCSGSMESRKFQKSNMNSATVDVLWDIDYHPLAAPLLIVPMRVFTRVRIWLL